MPSEEIAPPARAIISRHAAGDIAAREDADAAASLCGAARRLPLRDVVVAAAAMHTP